MTANDYNGCKYPITMGSSDYVHPAIKTLSCVTHLENKLIFVRHIHTEHSTAHQKWKEQGQVDS